MTDTGIPIRRLLDRRSVYHVDSGPFTLWWDEAEDRYKLNKSVGQFTQHHIAVSEEELTDLYNVIADVHLSQQV
jgi:hypothetical protein